MGNNIVVLSHTSDIDGVGSAALLRMKLNVPLDNIFFTDYTEGSIAWTAGRIGKLAAKGITLFITDLGVGSTSEKIFENLVKKIRKHGGKVFWFDHHVWSESAVRRIASQCEVAVVGENRDFCATEITRAMLRLNDTFSKKFVRIVHHSDFNLRPRDNSTENAVGTYALSIAYYNTLPRHAADSRLRHIVDEISNGKLFDAVIRRDAKRFDALNKKRVAYLLKHLYLGEHVAAAFTKDKVQTTHTCMQIMSRSRKPVAVLVDLYAARGHFRTETYDISGIARSMKGGGHPHAAGFTVDMKRYNGLGSEKERSRFVEMIDAKIDALRPES